MPSLDTTLERAQAEPRFTFEERANVVDRIARAMDHVHARRVVHCDLKPSNVFLTNGGSVKVLDFGAALFEHEGACPTGESFYGTDRYVAPERIAGEPFDRRSDVFSLGVLVFEILTGQLPWDAGTAPALLFAMCSKPPKSFRRAALASSVAIPRPMIAGLSEIVDRGTRDQGMDCARVGGLCGGSRRLARGDRCRGGVRARQVEAARVDISAQRHAGGTCEGDGHSPQGSVRALSGSPQ